MNGQAAHAFGNALFEYVEDEGPSLFHSGKERHLLLTWIWVKSFFSKNWCMTSRRVARTPPGNPGSAKEGKSRVILGKRDSRPTSGRGLRDDTPLPVTIPFQKRGFGEAGVVQDGRLGPEMGFRDREGVHVEAALVLGEEPLDPETRPVELGRKFLEKGGGRLEAGLPGDDVQVQSEPHLFLPSQDEARQDLQVPRGAPNPIRPGFHGILYIFGLTWIYFELKSLCLGLDQSLEILKTHGPFLS